MGVRSEVADVTGNVKYVRESVFGTKTRIFFLEGCSTESKVVFIQSKKWVNSLK